MRSAEDERRLIVSYLRACAREAGKLGDGFGAPGDDDRRICKLQQSTLDEYADALERGEHMVLATS